MKRHGYHLMIVPADGRKGICLRLSVRTLKIMGGLGLCLCLLVGYMAWQSMSAVYNRQLAAHLRAQVSQQRKKTALLSQNLENYALHFDRLDRLSRKMKALTKSLDKGKSKKAEKGTGGPYIPAEMKDILPGPQSLNVLLKTIQDLQHLTLLREQSVWARLNLFHLRANELEHTPNLWPIHGTLTSGFGLRSDPFTGRPEFHEGLDISAPVGTPIEAAASGVVVTARRDGDYGNLVEIDHGHGITTRYGHTSRILVKVGQKVHKGQEIALVGDTGRSTGPHLHFEVRREGHPVNPLAYLSSSRDRKFVKTASR